MAGPFKMKGWSAFKQTEDGDIHALKKELETIKKKTFKSKKDKKKAKEIIEKAKTLHPKEFE